MTAGTGTTEAEKPGKRAAQAAVPGLSEASRDGCGPSSFQPIPAPLRGWRNAGDTVRPLPPSQRSPGPLPRPDPPPIPRFHPLPPGRGPPVPPAPVGPGPAAGFAGLQRSERSSRSAALTAPSSSVRPQRGDERGKAAARQRTTRSLMIYIPPARLRRSARGANSSCPIPCRVPICAAGALFIQALRFGRLCKQQ